VGKVDSEVGLSPGINLAEPLAFEASCLAFEGISGYVVPSGNGMFRPAYTKATPDLVRPVAPNMAIGAFRVIIIYRGSESAVVQHSAVAGDHIVPSL
jgi:hypothetical protein